MDIISPNAQDKLTKSEIRSSNYLPLLGFSSILIWPQYTILPIFSLSYIYFPYLALFTYSYPHLALLTLILS